ncbi:MAG: DegV family protein [Papillibacter sp.]|nr:DegV family protein [Papillibacter sp.]
MRIKITSDSTCDLSNELIEKNNIRIIPLAITYGAESYKDGVDITPDDIFRRVESGGGIGSTAAVNVQEYVDIFTELLKDYDAIIHFTISSDMSSCYQNACIAAQNLSNVYVIDSLNLSTGIGHLVLDAAELAGEGKQPEEIVRIIENKREKLDVSFVISTLEYLSKGGRCSAVAAFGANLLKIRPCIEVKNGKMGVGKKYRGSFEKCLTQYVQDKLENKESLDLKRIFITDSGVPEEVRLAVREQVLSIAPFEEVIHTRAGCTVSNHCGPGTLGILFYRK